MTKSELETGMVVVTASEKVYMVNHGELRGIHSGTSHCYNEDLTASEPYTPDIVKVYSIENVRGYALEDILQPDKLESDATLIWSRPEEPQEMTVAELKKELEKVLGRPIKIIK